MEFNRNNFKNLAKDEDEDTDDNEGSVNENFNNQDNINDNNDNRNTVIQNTKVLLSPKSNIKFGMFCELLEKCLKQKSKVKSKLIMTFFNKYFSNDDNLFPLLRLLFPKYDKSRYNYGLQEKNIGKLYSQILSLPQTERELLMNWKNPNYRYKDAPSGDFVKVLVYILKNRVPTQSKMTINDVNDFLDEIFLAPETNDKTNSLTKLIKNSSLLEQKWIISIVLKDMKIGVGHETIFKLFHPKSIDVYNSTSSLLEVCNFIQNPQDPKFSENFYRVNLPVKPMLASRLTLHDIIDNFMSVPTIVETKFDGERIQCHYKDGEIKLFTRNGVDYTDLYGPKLNKFLVNSIKAKCAILDGEIVVWDKVEQKFCSFGENKSVALKKNQLTSEEEEEKELIFMIFDIIYLVTPSGQEHSLQEVVLADRKEILKNVVKAIPQKIEVIQGQKCNNIEEIFNYFNKSLENKEEGIIIKKLHSTYKLDDRTRDWVKMKCDYIDSLVDTLDLVIIGGYFGEGKRTVGINNDWCNNITTFLMGVVKKYDNNNPKNSVILPLVKVGTGYTIHQLETIRTRMKVLWKKYDPRLPPKLYGNWTPALKERPDVYVEDVSNSIILELRAAEITNSESFPTKLTLRFPRVMNVRFDKTVSDAMKYDEILQFYQNYQHNYLMKKKRKINENVDDLNENLGKEPKMGGKKLKYSKVMEEFKDTETNNLAKSSNLFRGCEFLFLNLDENITNNLEQKRCLESSVVENGGTKVQNFLSTTTHIVASKLDFRAINILKKNDIDIFRPKWVYDSIKYKKLMTKSPFYLTYSSQNSQLTFSKKFDCYGDSYFEDIDKETLKEVFENIKINENCFQKLQRDKDSFKLENKTISDFSNEVNMPKGKEYQKIVKELKQDFPNCEWIQNL